MNTVYKPVRYTIWATGAGTGAATGAGARRRNVQIDLN